MGEKCYLIENSKGDFSFIQGSYYRKPALDELFDISVKYMRGDIDWKFIEKRIKRDRDEVDFKRKERLWSYMKDVDENKIDIKTLIIDG